MTTHYSENITIVTACRNREENLRISIQSWLELAPFQIIICDWGSKIPLTHQRLRIEQFSSKVIINRHEADSWILTWAFNEVLSKVNTKFVLKLDCDHIVSKDFLDKNRLAINCFSRAHHRQAEKGQQYINGAFLSCTDLLRNVGYYDERLTTYGRDDGDLYQRMYDKCLEASLITKGCIRHLEQKEETRTEEQEVSKEAALAARLPMTTSNFLINRNRFLCGMLQPWDSSMFQDRKRIRSQFSGQHPKEEALIEYATFKTFQRFYKQYGLHNKTGVSANDAYLESNCNFDKVTNTNSSSLSLLKLFHKYAKIIGEGGQGTKAMAMLMAIMINSEEYTQN